MAVQVVVRDNLGRGFDIGQTTPNQIEVAIGLGLKYNGAGVIELDGSVLPADVFVQSGVYNGATQSLDLTLSNGSVVSIPVASLVPVTVDEGIQGSGTPTDPLMFDADTLPAALPSQGNPENYFVMSTPAGPDGVRVAVLDIAPELWTGYIESQAENTATTAVTGLLTMDVQDAFGNHLYYALP